MSTWRYHLSDMKQSDYFQGLIDTVNRLYEERKVYPPKKDIFKALKLTPYQDVKIVILGQDPYHQKGQAMGLAFGVNPDVAVPPSLKNIYKELERDLDVPPKPHGDLRGWARQGVLLLNTTLTVEDSRPNAHQRLGWERFTDEVVRAVDAHPEPVVFMLWGNHARRRKRLIRSDKHLILEASHPSPLSARYSFFGCGHFSKANAFLRKHGREEVDFSK